MNVLVRAASKHGSTWEIAAAIAEVLGAARIDASLRRPEEVDGVDAFQAVILGSAVYAGHWMKPALELVEREGDGLREGPVWLFSSGPVGDPPKPDEDPVHVRRLSGPRAPAIIGCSPAG